MNLKVSQILTIDPENAVITWACGNDGYEAILHSLPYNAIATIVSGETVISVSLAENILTGEIADELADMEYPDDLKFITDKVDAGKFELENLGTLSEVQDKFLYRFGEHNHYNGFKSRTGKTLARELEYQSIRDKDYITDVVNHILMNWGYYW